MLAKVYGGSCEFRAPKVERQCRRRENGKEWRGSASLHFTVADTIRKSSTPNFFAEYSRPNMLSDVRMPARACEALAERLVRAQRPSGVADEIHAARPTDVWAL
jgi:hypothetical protein